MITHWDILDLRGLKKSELDEVLCKRNGDIEETSKELKMRWGELEPMQRLRLVNKICRAVRDVAQIGIYIKKRGFK